MTYHFSSRFRALSIVIFISVFILLSTCCFSRKTLGLTGDVCRNNEDCASSYKCKCTESCSCIPSNEEFQACKSSDDCPKGEKCFGGCASETSPIAVNNNKSRDTDSKEENEKNSTDTNSSNNPNTGSAESRICIGIHHLKEIESDQLIFSEHREGNVLCDGNGSCATPGHIVSWNGKAMMMLTYCENYSKNCVKQLMKVNSPRFSRAIRIPSLTNGLEFTPLAARYATMTEEIVLTTLIHIGL